MVKLSAKVWNELFCPEFLRKMAEGKLRAVVLKRAHKLFNKRMFEMAYEEGFLEKICKLYPLKHFCSPITLL